MTAELVQTLAEHGISSSANGGATMMTTDEALVYRLLDSVAADGGLTPDAKKEVRGSEEVQCGYVLDVGGQMDRLGGRAVEAKLLVWLRLA